MYRAKGFFLKLTHFNIKLRNMMTQERLDNLMLPYVKQNVAKNIKIDGVIEEFTKIFNYCQLLLIYTINIMSPIIINLILSNLDKLFICITKY